MAAQQLEAILASLYAKKTPVEMPSLYQLACEETAQLSVDSQFRLLPLLRLLMLPENFVHVYIENPHNIVRCQFNKLHEVSPQPRFVLSLLPSKTLRILQIHRRRYELTLPLVINARLLPVVSLNFILRMHEALKRADKLLWFETSYMHGHRRNYVGVVWMDKALIKIEDTGDRINKYAYTITTNGCSSVCKPRHGVRLTNGGVFYKTISCVMYI